jgi:sortase A
MGTLPAMATETVKGADPGSFGAPTSVERVDTVGGGVTESDNINRGKDSSLIPPPFGSEDSNIPGSGESLTPGLSDMLPVYGGNVISGDTTYVDSDSGSIPLPDVQETDDSYYNYSNLFTLPDGLYYSDGSIGKLSIPTLGVSVKVYEEESLDNLRKGAGHFKSTSCWDGNVGFAAHNRGTNAYFGEIHTLESGDRIVYSTKLGTRTYEVYFVGKISETNYSRLGRTGENIVTLITCVRDIPELRWCVQAREVS